jgi:beta-galactosidase/beta-glucuronidase
MVQKMPRSAYPRPDFRREEWKCLNGLWDFSFDEPCYDRKILVPFAPESKLSGLADPSFHQALYYRRTFTLPEAWHGRRVLLHFGAVDYRCDVRVNGEPAVQHEGGNVPFDADITELLRFGAENEICVKAEDDPLDFEMPRGKQYWKEQSESIFYTRTSGIWQSVWLEPVSAAHLEKWKITPLLMQDAVRMDFSLSDAAALRVRIKYGEKVAAETVFLAPQKNQSHTFILDPGALGCWSMAEELTWSPEHPRLFDVTAEVLQQGTAVDTVHSYFGMRSISIENGELLLNGRPYFQKLVLDQGYWPDSLLTAPDDKAFAADIRTIREMGFNGVRLHQKIEDPQFLYEADRLGLLVWGEFPAAYAYSARAVSRTLAEWTAEIERDCSHPCLVVWTPLNESWGVPDLAISAQQAEFSQAMVRLTHALDPTRPVVDNDGWEHTSGDLFTVHDYEPDHNVLAERYADIQALLQERPGGRILYVPGHTWAGQPLLVTEFGGIAFQAGCGGWGYSSASDQEDFLRRYQAVTSALLGARAVQGFCYTQFTDVEQEINGLLTYDRTPKVPLQKIRAINESIRR